MKLNISRIAAAAVLAAVSTLGAGAQSLRTAYFDDNYMYRFQANPAFGNEGHGFVAFPGLGNLNLGTNGTIGVNHLIKTLNGETTTILNPGISASDALSGMRENCRLGIDLRETILAFGFKAFKGYNTVSVSARSNATIGFPKSLVRLAKEGIANETYDLSQFGGTARAWGEIALNHSHQINKQLRVGATLKVLVGVAAIDADVKRANLKLGHDNYILEADAQMHASLKGARYETSYNENTRRDYVSGLKVDDFGPINGYGAAIDLGAVYTLSKDWEFSLAFTDLGFVNWKENITATTNGLQTVESNDYSFNVDDNDTWDKFRDKLSMLYELEDKGDTGGRTTGIGATMNAGAQYTLPAYRHLKFGFLNTTRINGKYSWTDFRLSATVEPVKVLSAAVSMGYGTFGASFGALVNVKCPGFNLFVGTDCFPGKLAKQYVPLNSNMNVNLGLNFPF